MTDRRTWGITNARVHIVALLAILGLGGYGASGAQTDLPDGISGIVVDSSGAAVGAAKVYVIGGSMEQPETIAETIADAQGNFAFPRLWKDLMAAGAFKRLTHSYSLAAREGRGRMGWLTSIHRKTETPCRISLVELGEARGRVVDTAGKPLAGAEILPAVFFRSSEKLKANDYIRLAPDLAKPFATTTAADGSFVLRGVPAGCEVRVTISRRGFGSPQVSWSSTKPPTIALDGRLGRVDGRLVTPDGKDLPGKLALSIYRSAKPDEPTGKSFVLSYAKTINVVGDGKFQFVELPPGHYAIYFASDPDCGLKADPITDVAVGPDASVAGLSIPLFRLVTVTGRVIDSTTGEGVAGVWVNAFVVSGGVFGNGDSDLTDARGRYDVHVTPGTISIQPSSTPASHLGVDRETLPRFDVAADRDWPDFKLARAAAVDGIVLDSAGKPVAGADVNALKLNAMGFADSGAFEKTGPDGSFRLEQLDPDDTLPVRARTKSATTEGAVVIRPAELVGKLTLTIDPKHATRIHGVIHDRSGKPVAGATVGLVWGRNYVSKKTRFSGVGSQLEQYETDSEGRFTSSALWPGDRYKVTVQAPGYGNAESPEITGRAGDDHDFGAIRLVATGGRIAGHVLDTGGKPVSDATVFNRGDGPESVTTRTGAEGTFQLEGLFDGGKYLFVRKDGYRFTGTRVERNSGDATITLRRKDEPPPARPPADPVTPDEERAFAKRVLTKVWERFGENANANGADGCIAHMARLDMELALKWSGQLGGGYDNQVHQEAAMSLAETDADGALALLIAAGGVGRQYLLQQLADRFAPVDRAKALKFAEEATVQARAMNQPDRTGAMAKAGATLVRLGRNEPGRALIDEAAKVAEKLALESRDAYARGNVARALAPFDTERALALVEPMKKDNDRDRYLGFIATALAASDPQRALAVAAKIGDQSSSPQSVKVAIVHELGMAGRPDEALRVIDGMKGHYAATKYQSEACAWLAVALAARDKALAETLIDRALEFPLDQPKEFQSWTYFGGGAGEAAWSAACAQRAGYSDMAGAVFRVLAARPSDRHRDPSMDAQCQTIAAAILALTDRKAASQMLRDLELRWGQRLGELGRVVGRHWLMAWALADPTHAEQLFDAALAALESEGKVNIGPTGILKMAEVLLQPRERREQFLRNEIGATWYPGIDE